MAFFSFDVLHLRDRLAALNVDAPDGQGADAGSRTAMVLMTIVSDGARLFIFGCAVAAVLHLAAAA